MDVAASPALRDLATIVYQPRETMRRILEHRDRWTVQLVILAAICASVSDTDARRIGDVLPDLHPFNAAVIGVLGILATAVFWVLILFVGTWLARLVGRLLGGTAPAADLRAALAWGAVTVIWSVLLRVPLLIYQMRFQIPRRVQGREALLSFMAQGGCAFAVAVFAMQFVLFVWWLWVTSCTVAEAQRFSTVKGLANVALAVVVPIAIVGAAVIAFR